MASRGAGHLAGGAGKWRRAEGGKEKQMKA